jgi:hypothetical protein
MQYCMLHIELIICQSRILWTSNRSIAITSCETTHPKSSVGLWSKLHFSSLVSAPYSHNYCMFTELDEHACHALLVPLIRPRYYHLYTLWWRYIPSVTATKSREICIIRCACKNGLCICKTKRLIVTIYSNYPNHIQEANFHLSPRCIQTKHCTKPPHGYRCYWNAWQMHLSHHINKLRIKDKDIGCKVSVCPSFLSRGCVLLSIICMRISPLQYTLEELTNYKLVHMVVLFIVIDQRTITHILDVLKRISTLTNSLLKKDLQISILWEIERH